MNFPLFITLSWCEKRVIVFSLSWWHNRNEDTRSTHTKLFIELSSNLKIEYNFRCVYESCHWFLSLSLFSFFLFLFLSWFSWDTHSNLIHHFRSIEKFFNLFEANQFLFSKRKHHSTKANFACYFGKLARSTIPIQK